MLLIISTLFFIFDTMIGKTLIDKHLEQALMLDDSVAWYQSHSDEVKNYLLDLIRYVQLNKQGIDSTETIIGLYSETTEQITNGRKRAGTPYTLYDTGYFYRSMFISVLKDSIVVDADYDKMAEKGWWRINILGLTEENLNEYAQILKENYISHARKILGIDR